ncbi:hypothetical protein PIB30_094811 [Stylosanthes scabra]|uniref:Uncharacterized protein n=1 Tax=Stylosanthes scabra TaxID=79078 RepID=A0ABU6VU06_9FABA|nr:hypothetical protein [Stylosanthes scabra]
MNVIFISIIAPSSHHRRQPPSIANRPSRNRSAVNVAFSSSSASTGLPPIQPVIRPSSPRNSANNHRSRSSVHLVRSSTIVTDPFESAFYFKDPSSKHSDKPLFFRPPSELPLSPPSTSCPRNSANNYRSRPSIHLNRSSTTMLIRSSRPLFFRPTPDLPSSPPSVPSRP